jgi:hypothetical protein
VSATVFFSADGGINHDGQATEVVILGEAK